MCVLYTSIFSSLLIFYGYLFGPFLECSVVLDTLSIHFRGSILNRHLLMKVYILFSVFCVTRHVYDPLSKTALTLGLSIPSFMLLLIWFALQIFST